MTEMGLLRTNTGTLSLRARLKSRKLPSAPESMKACVRVPLNPDREMGSSVGDVPPGNKEAVTPNPLTKEESHRVYN